MKKEGKIGVHRDINSSIIRFEKEILMNVFYGVVKRFNLEIEKHIIEVSKADLWRMMGHSTENYDSLQIRHVIRQLTKSATYDISDNEKISGSVFVTREEDNSVFIEIPRTFRKYIFNRTDIGILAKVKKNQQLDVKELDYWDSILKDKKKSLVLLKEADIYNIKGKYAKRLYTLLIQWKTTYKLKMKMDKFKKIMEIPESYRMTAIDTRVLKPSIAELEKKTDFKNIKVNKIKEGRTITQIEFTFKIKEELEEPKQKKESKKTGLKQKKKDSREEMINNFVRSLEGRTVTSIDLKVLNTMLRGAKYKEVESNTELQLLIPSD